MHMDVQKEVLEAERRIRPHIRETPLDYSPYLSQATNCRAYLKLENLQLTGSFKLRGATNKILSLSPEERDRGLVTASSGNHAAACAYLFDKFSCQGTIFLPENASPAKIDALRLYGPDLQFHGRDSVEAEIFARETAERNHQIFISPYNDLRIVGGQGTIAIELARQLGNIDAVIVPVGGGGLISGIAGYLKSVDRKIEIIGCQPKNSAVLYESIQAGRIVALDSQPTLSDGTAGGIERGSITFEICRNFVDDYVLVTEEEIKEAIRLMLTKHSLLVEGAAALSVASLLKAGERFTRKTVVLIISGAKLSLDTLRRVLGN